MRYLNVVILGGLLLAPAMMPAQERAAERDRTQTQRYYDPYGKHYREWNDGEQRAWDHWVREERHRDYHDFAKANRREQRDYWHWRRDHRDWDKH